MGSRFYRAPEIIVCDPNYSHKVDVWGVGVIMAELMLHHQGNQEKASQNNNNQCKIQ